MKLQTPNERKRAAREARLAAALTDHQTVEQRFAAFRGILLWVTSFGAVFGTALAVRGAVTGNDLGLLVYSWLAAVCVRVLVSQAGR